MLALVAPQALWVVWMAPVVGHTSKVQALQVIPGAALATARRIQERSPRYAALPLGDLAESAQLLIAATVRYAESGDCARAEQHLRRLLLLRAAQEVRRDDLEQALEELRATINRLGCELTTPSRESLGAALSFVEARTLDLFEHTT